MPVTIRDVEHVAALARLSFDERQKAVLTKQLNTILAHMDKLNGLDTEGVEPLSHVIDFENVLREDREGPSLEREEALGNAPDRSEKFFRVPKVIGEH